MSDLVGDRVGTVLVEEFVGPQQHHKFGVADVRDVVRPAWHRVDHLGAVAAGFQGERLASFLFMQSMVRDNTQRRLLYEMDMALLQLRATIGETEAVVKLTGTYHNLLRQWAES